MSASPALPDGRGVLAIEDRVRVLTLDRPDALNAFNDDLYDAVADALQDAAERSDLAVVVEDGGRVGVAGQPGGHGPHLRDHDPRPRPDPALRRRGLPGLPGPGHPRLLGPARPVEGTSRNLPQCHLPGVRAQRPLPMYEEHERFDRELFAWMERNQIG